MYVSNLNAKFNEVDELGGAIARLVNGGNYAASFRCEELDGAKTVDEAIAAINKLYPDSKLRLDELSRVADWSSAWQEIAECIQYGVEENDGDEPNRPPLTEAAIRQLGELEQQMKTLLDAQVSNKATIYRFSAGREIILGDYPVFWSYRFIVLNPDGQSLLLHGSSSD